MNQAKHVGLVSDGAEWIQSFGDYHRPDAVRILDFPHAAHYVGVIGQAVNGEGTPEAKEWLDDQLHRLKHQGGSCVLPKLRALVQEHADVPNLREALAYLDKRETQMQYPSFRGQGWPIGSGVVESANKLVVEARLKGAGMHWAREHVNPMLALRNIVCSDRWAQAWPQIATRIREQVAQRRRTRRQNRRVNHLYNQCASPTLAKRLRRKSLRNVTLKPSLGPHPVCPRQQARIVLPLIIPGVGLPSGEPDTSIFVTMASQKISAHPVMRLDLT